MEYRVKGGYLYNFAKFVEWPAGSLPLPDSPFVIGVLDGGEALPILRTLLEGKRVDGHPVQVKQVLPVRSEKGLQILFVTRAAGSSPKQAEAVVGPTGTLVVGETEHFAEEGGMVGFTREEDRIRVCLNLERTTAAGLKVSSKLASVGRLVRTREP
ncbi:MAG TPA: YfiR family protein [Candidatus Limnocylindria bacterium]|nr:YfiR family protein [Candidatus Limnocylindria bacterium]